MAGVLITAGRPAKAEPLLRECRTLRRAAETNDRRTAAAASALGDCLSRLGRFAEAEPLLLDGYEGILRNLAKLPLIRPTIRDAMARLVRHFTAGHAAEPVGGYEAAAAAWRAKLVTGPLRPPATDETRVAR